MQCPHCRKEIHASWVAIRPFLTTAPFQHWGIRVMVCPACEGQAVDLDRGLTDFDWIRVFPAGGGRRAVHNAVPQERTSEYIEACIVLPLSPKASAALSRRCLQAVLKHCGYDKYNLVDQIDLALNEKDPSKRLPSSVLATIDAIRGFGNFSAHTITDKTTLQVIDVEPHEAEWCLEIIESLFDAVYIAPFEAAQRKAALDAKLASAGKAASK